MKSFLDRAKPKDIIFIDEIKVVGPDKQPRKLGQIAFTILSKHRIIMFKRGKALYLTIYAFCGGAAFAQEPLDGAWVKTTTKEKDVIPYDYIREADVFWAKRIWRMIDVREKMNLPFKYPQEPLIEILHTAAKNGELTVYDPSIVDADQFKR
jgi:hypothetical protein